jgi:hypothetical protein
VTYLVNANIEMRYFLFFLVVLGFEFRASHLLGSCSATYAVPEVFDLSCYISI